MNDNRDYEYGLNSKSSREEYEIIVDWIPSGSQVIDLGCGDGTLLSLLKLKGVKGDGVDISVSGVKATRKKGIKADIGRIDIPLDYRNKQYDFAICNVTLQMVMYPEVLLLEMKRIAYRQIVTFPNFAFILNRLDLLFNGRMPKVMIPGYEWYSTGHIHQLSIRDFIEFCQANSINILEQSHIYPGRLYIFPLPKALLKRFPNLFSSTTIFLTGESED